MIGVRSQPKGRVSPGLVDRLAVDTVVAISPPGGSMTLPADEQHGPVLLLGAGSGVTPLLALAEEALEGHSEAEVALVLVERTRADVLGQEIVDGLARTYPDRFRFDVLCTRPGGHPDARRVSEAVQRLMGESGETCSPPPSSAGQKVSAQRRRPAPSISAFQRPRRVTSRSRSTVGASSPDDPAAP